MILAVMVMPFFLGACTTSQTAYSSHAGKSLSKKKYKSSRKARKARSKKKVAYYKKRKSSSRKASKRRNAKRSSKRKSVKRRSAKRSSRRGSKARYRKLIARHARANGVPVRLALAVVQVESAYRANARGAAGEIGLMQLMPRTARHIGYKGSMRKLYNPNTNLRYGMKYLGKAYRLGGRTSCGAVLKYNAGHGAKRMNPISRRYCRRVAKILRRRA